MKNTKPSLHRDLVGGGDDGGLGDQNQHGKTLLFLVIGSIAQLPALQAQKIIALEIVAVFDAETGINELLGKNLDRKQLVATFQTAFERNFKNFGVIMAEDHVFRLDGIDIFLLLLPLFDIAVELAIFSDRVAPELAAATGFLANLEFDTFFLFVLG